MIPNDEKKEIISFDPTLAKRGLDIIFDLEAKVQHKNLPEEPLVRGTTVEANILTSDDRDILLTDVTPSPLNIRTKRGLCQTLIEKNTIIPCQTSRMIRTVFDFQTKMTIQLLQGENYRADRNQTVGQFSIDGLTPTKHGSVQVKLEINIDKNGILNVTAIDLANSLELQVKRGFGQGLTYEEIDWEFVDTE